VSHSARTRMSIWSRDHFERCTTGQWAATGDKDREQPTPFSDQRQSQARGWYEAQPRALIGNPGTCRAPGLYTYTQTRSEFSHRDYST
jgi:hypothetical protein